MISDRPARLAQAAANRQSDLTVVLEDIHDPHNAAAIFRTCDALGIQAIHLIFDQEKVYNPQRVGKSSSSSANKWLTFYRYTSTADCFSQLKKAGFVIWSTILDPQAESINQVKLPSSKIALVVGNEHRGISPYAAKHSDKLIFLPMLGLVQSLNVSVAAAIFLWHLSQARNFAPKITTSAQQKLVNDWLYSRR